MAEISRNKTNFDGSVTPIGVQCTAGTLYGLNANLIKLDVANTSGVAIDLRIDDTVANGIVEQIVKEISPLAFFVGDDSTGGEIFLVVDRSISAEDIQHRVRSIGRTADWNRVTNTYAVTQVGANAVDISGTTATTANMFVTVI